MVSKVFDEIAGKFDGFFNFIESLHERNIFIYSALALIVLLIFGGIFAVIFIVMANPINTVSTEEQQILDNALSYCAQKGFNAWEWVNKSSLRFRCVNESSPVIVLDEYYLP